MTEDAKETFIGNYSFIRKFTSTCLRAVIFYFSTSEYIYLLPNDLSCTPEDNAERGGNNLMKLHVGIGILPFLQIVRNHHRTSVSLHGHLLSDMSDPEIHIMLANICQ